MVCEVRFFLFFVFLFVRFFCPISGEGARAGGNHRMDRVSRVGEVALC